MFVVPWDNIDRWYRRRPFNWYVPAIADDFWSDLPSPNRWKEFADQMKKLSTTWSTTEPTGKHSKAWQINVAGLGKDEVKVTYDTRTQRIGVVGENDKAKVSYFCSVPRHLVPVEWAVKDGLLTVQFDKVDGDQGDIVEVRRVDS